MYWLRPYRCCGADNTTKVPLTTDQLNQIVSIAKGYGLVPGDLAGTGGANQDEKRGLVKLDLEHQGTAIA